MMRRCATPDACKMAPAHDTAFLMTCMMIDQKQGKINGTVAHLVSQSTVSIKTPSKCR